ncbi:hypothetical protein IMSAGC006_02286 [Muribaculaceae bacterium]|nr:hypothetical protein IMSAGC006_02286 [Muribaculaceae bacterium]
MRFCEFLHTLDDLVGGPLAPRIDMACRKLLSVAGGTGGVEHIDHIIARSEKLWSIGLGDGPLRWRCATVVIDYERIFLVRIKIGRIADHPVNLRPVGRSEFPRLDFAELDFSETLGPGIGKQSAGAALQIVDTGFAGILISLAEICQTLRRPVAHGHGLHIVHIGRQGVKPSRRRVKGIDTVIEPVLADEIDTAVGRIPATHALDRRIKVARHGLDLARVQIHHKKLYVEIVGQRMVSAVVAYAAERRRRACKENAAAIGRIHAPGHKLPTGRHQSVGFKRSKVKLIDSVLVKRADRGSLARSGHKQTLAVGTYVH